MNLYLQDTNVALERIFQKEINVCVVGVGTIGLPLATFLAKSGFNVTGLDISQKRVDRINTGEVIFEYTEILKTLIENRKLVATTDPNNALKNCEIIFVCVPTPLNSENEMDISNLNDVAKKISPSLKPGMLLIFESSVAIGTTSEITKKIEEITGLKFGKDLGIAYCPERYNPTPEIKKKKDENFNINSQGITFSLDKISRVVGGIDDKSTTLSQKIYEQFITTGVTKLSSIEAAEATKLTENIFRDVNIALVNEFAKVFPKFNLDVFEIIDAAKTKPFAFMPHYPGAGVGGECIPVDTWYLISQAEKIGLNTELMKIARKVNDSMPKHMIDILEYELKNSGKTLTDANVSILGLCYKKNIPDIRLSPTLNIISILEEKRINFSVCDPLVEKLFSNTQFPFKSVNDIAENSDAILLVTDHDIFKTLDLIKIKSQMNTPIIIDGRNFFQHSQLENLGIIHRVIGKPQNN